ncbi:MAG: DNA alkylation repair protein [Muribaculaceae bacterium]|nr:DNA alkylation repair protein [Muribaculaceae bacterium]
METVKEIKQQFMAFRNGIVADTLRKAGLPFSIIFGLQLPQIRLIAQEVAQRYQDKTTLKKIASELIDDHNIRESRILGFVLMPPEKLTFEEATGLCSGILSREEADLLPFLLLRKTAFIPQILKDNRFGGKHADYLKETLIRFL